MKIISPHHTKFLVCLNQVEERGRDAFDNTKKIIQDLSPSINQLRLNSDLNNYLTRLDQAKLFLSRIFKGRVKDISTTIPFSVQWGLNDKDDPEFCMAAAEEISQPTAVCKKTWDAISVLDEISKDITNLNIVLSAEKAAILQHSQVELIKYKQQVLEWLGHKMRDVVITKVLKAKFVERHPNIVILWRDHAQKYLPTANRELDNEYFGKGEGIPWEIVHCAIGDRIKVYVFVTERSGQQKESVMSVLYHVCRQLKETFPEATKVHIQSDRAPNYHSVGAIMSVPFINVLLQHRQIQIAEWIFTEAGCGKGLCDSMAGQTRN